MSQRESRAFLLGAPEMEPNSGVYSRFHLLVAYLLDHEHWGVGQLLRAPPPEAMVEKAVRSQKPLAFPASRK
jgi:hypothetical protein